MGPSLIRTVSIQVQVSVGQKLYDGGIIPFQLETDPSGGENPVLISATDALQLWDEFNPFTYYASNHNSFFH
ncbi:hypothetical protein CQ043_10645 [Paenibacillus sp. MYb63]|nr:hypothetical protein CQ043_10645 [Paenibacillus sp. MYb63]PRA51449.1 hypothetical protein CQ061_03800 [Paenibacillus sp. MYb67]